MTSTKAKGYRKAFTYVSTVCLTHSIHAVLPPQVIMKRARLIAFASEEVHSLEIYGGTSHTFLHNSHPITITSTDK